MSYKTTKKYTVIVALAGLALDATTLVCYAEDPVAKTKQLTELQNRINDLQQKLEHTRTERTQEERSIRRVEQKIGTTLSQLRHIDRELKAETLKLKSLLKREQKTQKELKQQVKGLENQIRSAYTMGHQDYVKMLFSQQNPAEISRVLTYYRYLNSARVNQVNEVQSTLTRLKTMEQQTEHRSRKLVALRQEQSKKKQALSDVQSRRSEILTALDRKIRNQSKVIKGLKEDEKRLQGIINDLNSYFAEKTQPTDIKASFSEQRGRLKLPLKGSIFAGFGQAKNLGDLKWKGLFVTAPPGQPVASVFQGRVAFADWLRGFGLVLILEHGNGYMSLYGHNQSLYKEVGDWVETGQVIASSGNTGGPPRPGLYFEIRHNGEPRNPLYWCRPR